MQVEETIPHYVQTETDRKRTSKLLKFRFTY